VSSVVSVWKAPDPGSGFGFSRWMLRKTIPYLKCSKRKRPLGRRLQPRGRSFILWASRKNNAE